MKDSITAADIAAYRDFSLNTFGPGARNEAKFKHLAEELDEAREDPTNTEEWIDIVILALDGAYRNGASPEEIIAAYHAKCAKNLARTWPDWKDIPEGEHIKHVEVAE